MTNYVLAPNFRAFMLQSKSFCNFTYVEHHVQLVGVAHGTELLALPDYMSHSDSVKIHQMIQLRDFKIRPVKSLELYLKERR